LSEQAVHIITIVLYRLNVGIKEKDKTEITVVRSVNYRRYNTSIKYFYFSHHLTTGQSSVPGNGRKFYATVFKPAVGTTNLLLKEYRRRVIPWG
jgi:hypothetical protein